MSACRRLLTWAVAAPAALAVALPCAASAASSPTITACVKTKTGVAKILTAKQAKRKCPKGSRKITWTVTGADGRNGANGKDGANGTNGRDGRSGLAGSPLQVHDSTGNLVGLFAKATEISSGSPATYAITTYTVQRPDGGLYNYLPNGTLFPSDPLGAGSPLFMDPQCAGPAYFPTVSADPATFWLRMVGSQGRVVYRAADPAVALGFGPARVWRFSTATATVPNATTFYRLSTTTTAAEPCVAVDAGSAPAAGATLALLTSIQTPPDPVGALEIG